MRAELPASVQPFAGRITDIDSHEQIPAQAWVEIFGEDMRSFAEIKLAQPPSNGNHPNVPGYAGDVGELTPENVWQNKGPSAPGALDMHRRLDVMDMMQIKRQLMFPTAAGIYGMLAYTSPPGSAMWKVYGDKSDEMAKKMMAAGNEWLLAANKVSDRVRPVGNLYGDTPEELIANARVLIKRGIRAMMVASSRLPGGVSPADDALDPFYAMLAEAKVTFTLHVSSQDMFLRTDGWGKARAFQGFKVNEEMDGDPLKLSTLHIAPQHFLTVMVLGGVFERHPDLRMGVVEYSAHWIGPVASAMDMWYANMPGSGSAEAVMKGQKGYRLSLKPSEYIRRNVRVSPFDFEPVGEYIAKFGLNEVYCFASDYPHVEGGRDSIGRLAENLTAHGHGRAQFEKFFVTNGEWLLPD
jgi:predicted TIM-barrel fold metal-dependent hydrolase